MKKSVFLFLLMSAGTEVLAQEPQFTQFFNVPLHLNPALTGDAVKHRFGAAYRNQWPGVKRAFSTYMAAYDCNLENQNLGIGGFALQDIGGTGGITTTQAALNVSYKVKLGYNSPSYIRAGIQAAYGLKSLTTANLVFNDQFITGAAVSEDVPTINNISYVDFGAGLAIKTRDFTGGMSARHLNRPDVSMSGSSDALPMFIGIHGDYRIVTRGDTGKYSSAIHVLANFSHQLSNDRLELGAYYFFNYISAGALYRGLPLKKYAAGYSNNESLALIAAYEIPGKNLKIGYSYDFTISALNFRNSAGAHEITLLFETGRTSEPTVKRTSKIRQTF